MRTTERRRHRSRSWPAAATTAAGALAAAVLLSGCGSPGQVATGSQVSSWMSTSSGGGAAIGQVEVDSRNVNLALADHNAPAAVRTVCALLTNDALTAIGSLPAPDNTLTDDLNRAYQDASSAGSNCYKGASGNRSLLAQSAAQRSKLVVMLATAVTRYEALTGHPPSTTTTLSTASNDDPFAP